jgi:hypothetical protein
MAGASPDGWAGRRAAAAKKQPGVQQSIFDGFTGL